ncbi:MAG: helix-turn-helix domain-containing protein [Armatimonadetes bacterium]|nr:helix-turn-helix domain-containing protein [Armatimonadota bacterium]
MDKRAIGAALRAARKSHRLSVAKAAAAIDVSPATLKRWESGRGLPSVQEAADVVAAWGGRAEAFGLEARGPRSDDDSDGGGRPVLRLLRSARHRSGLTMEDVSLATGISQPSVHRYETGERVPGPETLQRLGSAVGLSPLEADTLSRSVFEASSGQAVQGMAEQFLVPGGLSRVCVYSLWDGLLRGRLDAEDVWPAASDAVHGLMIMGDHRGALELWSEFRRAGSPAKPGQDQATALATTIGLARSSVGGMLKDPSGLGTRVLAMRPGPEQAQTFLQLTRIARTLRTGPSGREWCRLAGTWADRSGNASIAFLVELNERDIEFSVSRDAASLRAVERLRERAEGALQRYNADVALAGIHEALGDVEGLASDLDRCRAAESAFGLGSPMVRRIERRSGRTERRADP